MNLLLVGLLAILPISLKADTCIVQHYLDIPEAIQKCTILILDNLDIPGGEPLRLPLRDGQRLYFRGTTTFGYAVWDGPLVVINGTNVAIEGETGAVLDGQGPLYWDGLGEWGSLKPKFFTIQLHNSSMKGINILNSPVHCVLLADSSDVVLSEWNIDNGAGDPSVAGNDRAGHNTDGFDVWNGTNIKIKNSIVTNQDDCVAIRCGNGIVIDDLTCYGGHGLSISVGFSNESIAQNTLRNVAVMNSVLMGGQNGIHIKTHVDGGLGVIENVTYSNIVLHGLGSYGINIQQNYRNLPGNSSSFPSEATNNIPIKNLQLIDISGTLEDKAVPYYIFCAEAGCFDWTFSKVLLKGGHNSTCNFEPDNFVC
ncbi:unnamed protein product [Ceutorhynchus assimilis]|uniref:endo-polygalacturonase n=1 Tax=Ceutorhynchus assimilis TaxID=467358 RepID=A0A9N9ML95_9CUCU|nr:unnamed protein product [Ceutorhynchus assimilis]